MVNYGKIYKLIKCGECKRMARKKRKESRQSLSKEISNNILVLILVIIVFVSILGTMIVKEAINNYREPAQIFIEDSGPSAVTGRVGLTILPPDEAEGDDK